MCLDAEGTFQSSVVLKTTVNATFQNHSVHPDLSAEYDVDEHIIAFFLSLKTSPTHDQTSVDYVGLLQTTALLPRPHSEMDTYVL